VASRAYLSDVRAAVDRDRLPPIESHRQGHSASFPRLCASPSTDARRCACAIIFVSVPWVYRFRLSAQPASGAFIPRNPRSLRPFFDQDAQIFGVRSWNFLTFLPTVCQPVAGRKVVAGSNLHRRLAVVSRFGPTRRCYGRDSATRRSRDETSILVSGEVSVTPFGASVRAAERGLPPQNAKR